MTILNLRVSFDDLCKNLFRVWFWNDLKTSNLIIPYSFEWHHALNTLKPFFMERILVKVQIFNVGIPIAFTYRVPPGPPRNYGIETCDKLIGVPYFRESLFNFGMGSYHPRSPCMTTSIRYEESHVVDTGPILIFPGGRICSLDSASNGFEPFPEGIFSLGDLFFSENVFEYDTAITQERRVPLIELFELKALNGGIWRRLLLLHEVFSLIVI